MPQAQRNVVVSRPPTVVERSILSYPSQPPQQLQQAARLQGQPPPTESMCTVTYSFSFLTKIWIARHGWDLYICRYFKKDTERDPSLFRFGGH